MKMTSYIKAILSALALIQTKVQLFIIITAYVLLGNVISAKKVKQQINILLFLFIH